MALFLERAVLNHQAYFIWVGKAAEEYKTLYLFDFNQTFL